MVLLAFSATAKAVDPILRHEPPFKSGSLRTFREVSVSDLVEGSPEWVFWKLMLASKKMDFEELAKYQSPIGVWGAKKNTPETMAAFTMLRLDGSLRIDDSIYDGDVCCIYMGFQGASGRTWQTAYRYFLKIDGKWLRVAQREWESGKLQPVPNTGAK